jgi:hypothetical protein
MINFSLLEEAYPNDDKSIKKKKKVIDEEKCKPLQAPPYTIPLACDNSSKHHEKVMNDAINTNFKKSDYKKDGIKAFDYDEMDAYLTVSDIKTNNTDKTEEYRITPFLANYLRTLRDNLNKPINQTNDNYLNIEQFSNNNNSLKVDINLYNLFLFIFLGIVIILLIDQITKLVSLHKI